MFTQERLIKAFFPNQKGMALYLVLAVLIVVVLVAGMFLNLVLSQSRLTHHTVSRAQAYYAARLGMNYAIEMLSRNETDWTSSSEFNHTIGRMDSLCASGVCSKIEPDLPAAINNITIYVGNATEGLGGTRSLNVTVDYIYQM